MRVAVVGTADAASLASSFAAAATSLGHVASVVHAPQLVAGSRALFFARRASVDGLVSRPWVDRIRRALRERRPDIVVVVKGRFLSADAVKKLRRELGVPMLNYYPDHPLWPGHNDTQIARALAEYDEVLVWGGELAARLGALGIPGVRVVPFGYDPTVYSPRPKDEPFVWDATVIGQCYPQRLRFAEALTQFNIRITGRGWSQGAADGPLAGRVGEQTLPGRETCVTYWRSRVALNVLADWNVPAHNMRSYEIPASGTAMVATRTPDHEALFGERGALLVSTPEEAREAVRLLVADDDMRERVARTGRELVAGHTYAARMRELLGPWTGPSDL